jgi:hypothetical protein
MGFKIPSDEWKLVGAHFGHASRCLCGGTEALAAMFQLYSTGNLASMVLLLNNNPIFFMFYFSFALFHIIHTSRKSF